MDKGNSGIEDSDVTSPTTLNDDAVSDALSDCFVMFDHRLSLGQSVDASLPIDRPSAEQVEFAGAAECLRLLHQLKMQTAESDFEAGVSHAEERGPFDFSDEGLSASDCFRQFGRFSLKRLLGRGGFGLVFLADDPALGRDVALKIPRLDRLGIPEFRRQCMLEGRAAGLLDHPNIVTIHEAGEINGICYLAMVYCDGPTLADFLSLRSIPPSPMIAAALVEQLADGVEHAHRRGVLHRDLKPSNILLQTRDQQEDHIQPIDGTQIGTIQDKLPDLTSYLPRISDFGMARVTEVSVLQTQPGMMIGTPAYMAPEQISDRVGPISCATDVYGLGLILYELLTLRRPFSSQSQMEVSWQILNQPVSSPQKQQRTIPSDLACICLKCLEKEPERRYSSAAQLQKDLRNFLRGLPITARLPSPPVRLLKWIQRNPLISSLIALVILVSIGLVSAAAWHVVRIEQMNAELRDVAGFARQQEELARTSATSASVNAYVSNVRLSSELLHNRQIRLMAEILNKVRPGANQADFREFCWRYLWQMAQNERDFPVHETELRALAVSENGQTLAAFCGDRSIRIWDVPTAVQKWSLTGFLYEPKAIAISPDATLLAASAPGSCAWCGEIHIWDSRTGLLLKELHRVGVADGSITFLPHTPEVVVPLRTGVDSEIPKGSAEDILLLWNYSSDSQRRYSVGNLAASATAVSPDGSILAVACSRSAEINAEIHLIAANNLHLIRILTTSLRQVTSLDFSADGTLLTAGSSAEIPGLWDVASGVSLNTQALKPLAVPQVTFFGKGRSLLYIAEQDGKKLLEIVTDPKGTEAEAESATIDFPVLNLAGAGQEQTMVLWGAEAVVRMLRPTPVPAVEQYPFTNPTAMAFSSDGHLWTVNTDGSDLRKLQAEEKSEHHSLFADSALMSIAALAPDASSVAAYDQNNSLLVFDFPHGRVLKKLSATGSKAQKVTFSSDSRLLAVADQTSAVTIRDLVSETVMAELPAQNARVSGLKFSPDGKLLAVSTADGRINFWITQSGNLLWQYTDPRTVSDLVFTPDGRTLVTVSTDGAARLWGVYNDSRRELFGGHKGRVDAVTISPDGNTMATGGSDRSVRLWHIQTGHELLSFTDLSASVSKVTFSADGTRLAASLEDGTVLVWNAPAETESGTAPPVSN